MAGVSSSQPNFALRGATESQKTYGTTETCRAMCASSHRAHCMCRSHWPQGSICASKRTPHFRVRRARPLPRLHEHVRAPTARPPPRLMMRCLLTPLFADLVLLEHTRVPARFSHADASLHARQRASQRASEPTRQPDTQTSQSASQPVSQSASQPASQPASQLAS